MTMFYLLLLFLGVGVFFLNALLLFGEMKVFKIKAVKYWESIKLLFLLSISYFVIGVLLQIINLGLLSELITLSIVFYIFYKFLSKKYKINWQKSAGLYISFIVSSIILTLLIILPIRSYVVEPFLIAGESMSPTLQQDDYLLVNKLKNEFVRGDIVTFYYPKDKNQVFIQRIVGLPGEKVEIKEGSAFVNDQVIQEDYITGETKGNILLNLTDTQYFVLGDNRSNSNDSRYFGPIEKGDIRGKVFFKASGSDWKILE